MNVQEVKDILDYQSNKHDVYMTTVIPLFIDYIKDYCNNQFLASDGLPLDELPGGVKIAVAKMVEFNLLKSGVTNKTLGEVSYSYDLSFPASIMQILQPYTRIRV